MGRLLAAALIAVALVAGANAAEFRRGVGLHTLMNWATPDLSSPQRFARPPFSPPRHDISETLLDNLREAGFDFIRLTVDPGPFLTFRGADREALDETLKANVLRLAGHGFGVVVDFHPNRQIAGLDPISLLKDERGGRFDDLVAVLARTAKVLAGLGLDDIALEALNEPPYGYNPREVARWQRMLERIHAAIRREAPQLTIVLSGARGGGIRGLTEIDAAPFNDGRTLFSFHYYDPFSFTHQGVKGDTDFMRPLRYFANVPYPAGSVAAETVLKGLDLEVEADAGLSPAARRKALAEARKRLSDYLASGFGRADIDADFDRVAEWAKDHGIAPEHIFLGEFGAVRSFGPYRGAEAISYEAWLRDVREAAEARGFVWSVWSVKSHGGMAMVRDEGSPALDPVSMRALGMKP
ncbi:MAG: glycoside hydrolase family 5 protein [Flavobacteriaceae bacterium]